MLLYAGGSTSRLFHNSSSLNVLFLGFGTKVAGDSGGAWDGWPAPLRATGSSFQPSPSSLILQTKFASSVIIALSQLLQMIYNMFIRRTSSMHSVAHLCIATIVFMTFSILLYLLLHVYTNVCVCGLWYKLDISLLALVENGLTTAFGLFCHLSAHLGYWSLIHMTSLDLADFYHYFQHQYIATAAVI